MNLQKKDYGTVVGPHPRTAEAGFKMLLAGGNAVDAAVAAAFAEGVVEPSHNGIAGYGGCVLIYRKQTRDVIAIDYNTAALLPPLQICLRLKMPRTQSRGIVCRGV